MAGTTATVRPERTAMPTEPGRFDIQVTVQGEWSVAEDGLASACCSTLSAEGRREGEMSLTLLDDEAISGLNREYFGKDRPTDVIAFPLFAEGEPLVGDLYIGYEQASRQAAELGIRLDEELLRLTIHGTLHILGHTHPEGPERVESPMYRRQEELLASFLSSRSG